MVTQRIITLAKARDYCSWHCELAAHECHARFLSIISFTVAGPCTCTGGNELFGSIVIEYRKGRWRAS